MDGQAIRLPPRPCPHPPLPGSHSARLTELAFTVTICRPLPLLTPSSDSHCSKCKPPAARRPAQRTAACLSPPDSRSEYRPP